MIGVYVITNKINNKQYVGASKDIATRWKGHEYESTSPGKSYNKALYRAFRKYGIDNFSFSVLEECQTIEEALQKESIWIDKLGTLKTGYNETEGGLGCGDRTGEKNGRAKLTEEEVVQIRTARLNGMNRQEAYEKYGGKLTLWSFRNVWQGVNWKHIMPEIYTPEALETHNKNIARRSGENNPNSKLTVADVMAIRRRKLKGETAFDVFQDYKSMIGRTTFYSVWHNQSWKSVIVEEDV